MIHLIPGFNLWEIRSLLGNSSFGIQYLDILGKDSTGDDNGNKTGFVGTWNPNSSISLEAAYYDYLNYVVGLSGSGQICNFSLDGQISYTVLDTGFYDTNWYNANLTATLPLSSRSNVFLNLLLANGDTEQDSSFSKLGFTTSYNGINLEYSIDQDIKSNLSFYYLW